MLYIDGTVHIYPYLSGGLINYFILLALKYQSPFRSRAKLINKIHECQLSLLKIKVGSFYFSTIIKPMVYIHINQKSQ